MKKLNKLLACAMALAVPLCTWAQTETEPNNSSTQATATAYNTAMDGSTGACAPTDNSVDYFSFTPPAQGVLRIITSMSNSGATDLPVSVILRQSSSSALETFTVTAGANNVPVIDTVYRTCSGTGVYYISIPNPSGTVCTNYSFTYDVLDPVYANDTEPNNSYSQALDTLADGVNQEGHLDFLYDNNDDYYRILAPTDGMLNLTVSAEQAGTSTADSITVYLRTSNNSQLQHWKVGVGANGVANTQQITRTCTGTEQVYFLEFYSPNLCGVSYQFNYTVTAPLYADDTEPNQSYTQYSVANANTPYDGRVAFEYDNTYDYWQLQAPNDGLLTVTILAENAGASTGTMNLYLRQANSSTLQTWTVNIGANGSPVSNTFTRTCTGTENVYYLEPTDPTVCGVSYRFNYTVTAPGFNDDAEPNDSYSQAVDTITVGTNHDGRIGFEYDDNDDYYRILAPNDGVLNLTVSAEQAGTSTADSITVYLRTSSNSQLQHWKVGVGANGVANTQQITRTCTGTEQVYFLEFYSPNLCGVSYQFNYTVTAPLYADDTEPNQSSTQHSVANANTPYDGRVAFEYDNAYDYWQLQAPNDGLLTVTILAENAGASTGTMNLYLRQANSSTLQTWTVNIGANGSPVSNTFTHTCTGTENVYYLEPADPTVCGVSYRFNYTVAAPLFTDDVEPNNSFTQAGLINLDAASTFGRVSFEYDNNDDYFKVNHPGGVLRVITSAENAGAAGVMSVYLRNSSSSTILVNSAALVGGNGVAAQDTTETAGPMAAGVYYIEVYSPSVCGVSYRLHCNDDDNDGVCNSGDLCANTPTGEGVNTDGCSCSQVTIDDGVVCTLDECLNGDVTHTFQDADGDLTCDANDGCVNDPNKTAPGACGCGNPDVPTTWYADADGDGSGDPNNSQAGFTCIQPTGYVADNTDGCDNDPAKTAPGACGCGVADVATTWYADTDGDGLGDPNDPQAGFTCIQPTGYVADNTDACPAVSGTVGSTCDDGNAQTSGDALDANCQCVGSPVSCDDGDPCTLDTWDGTQCIHTFQDADGDGTCDANDGCVTDPNKTAPGACGCGVADVATTWYADADGDGLGDPNNSQAGFTCIQPTGYVADNTDLCPSTGGTVGSACDDGNAQTTGDALDANCQCVGSPVSCDDGDPCTLDTWDGTQCVHTFQDADGDGTCDANDGCVNDPNKTAPGACGCGVADVATTWYADADGDGLGDPNNSQAGFTCNQPTGYVADNTDLCPSVGGTVGSACDDGNAQTTGDALDANCQCVGTPIGEVCTGNEVQVIITTDANPGQITWEITNANNVTIATGGPSTAQANQTVTETACLGTAPASACYGFRIMDSFGDGISNGGWQLRTTTGKLLLRDDFSNGSASPDASPLTLGYISHGFCLPEGNARPAGNECGVFNNGLGNKVYSVSVPGASQYEFEFSDPDAGFVARVTSTHNYVHFWDIPAPGLTPGVKYLARVRTNAAAPLASAHFGTACQMGLGIAQVVHCSDLISAPAYGHSCNETRAFNTNNSFIYAKPVTGANEYHFRIFNLQEGYDQTFIRNTYILQLKWNASVAPPLVNGSTYSVEIQVKVNSLYSGFCPSNCTISIVNPGTRPEARKAEGSFGETVLWPNPVHDGQVNLSISGLNTGSPAGDQAEAPQQITVDVQDIYGRQVFKKGYSNNGDRFTTVLDLPGDIATGVYMVNITVNGERTVQRLSVIR